jgi:hypothetical protein
MFEMADGAASAIACGHKDAVDLDRLRHDPLMKVAVALSGQQSTISRLENAPSRRRRLGSSKPWLTKLVRPHRRVDRRYL